MLAPAAGSCLSEDGRATARLLNPHPALASISGAVGDDTDEAVQLLQEACERYGVD